jgi:hypothetical protein
MPEWTQEPWQVHVDEDNGEVVVGIPTGSKGREWCSYYLIAEMSWYDAEDRKRVLANAYRIQACVNSCQSLPDPSVVPEMVERIEKADDSDAVDTIRYLKVRLTKAKGVDSQSRPTPAEGDKQP